jgi:DNA-binding NtrC family response regulator
MRILIVEDDLAVSELLGQVLGAEGYGTDRVESGEAALTRLQEASYDALLIDVHLPGKSGLDVTREVRATHPQLPVIVMTAFGSLESVAEAIGCGAFDYLRKPVDFEQLKHVVDRATANPRTAHVDTAPGGDSPSDIVGTAPAMIEVYKTIARVAPLKTTVLIVGESGTGKELVARSVHEHSRRAKRPLLAIDCGALPETLLDSELFGHLRGSFTGAVSDKKGLLEEADGATCFLDEIGDISLAAQARLLRLLQEGELRRIGSHKWIKVDVRIIAATNRDLPTLVRAGKFRPDLFHRLDVVTIEVPPLRSHAEDVPALIQHFLHRYGRLNDKQVTGVAADAFRLLCGYNWPGNVRELEHAIEHAVAMARTSIITIDDLPPHITATNGHRRPLLATADSFDPFADSPTLEELKQRYVRHVLDLSKTNVARAALRLGIDRRSLYRLMSRYQMELPGRNS